MKNTILYGSFIVIFLLLMLPNISAIEYKTYTECREVLLSEEIMSKGFSDQVSEKVFHFIKNVFENNNLIGKSVFFDLLSLFLVLLFPLSLIGVSLFIPIYILYRSTIILISILKDNGNDAEVLTGIWASLIFVLFFIYWVLIFPSFAAFTRIMNNFELSWFDIFNLYLDKWYDIVWIELL